MPDQPSQPGQVQDLIDDFRRQIIARERAAATEMVRRYGAIWQDIKGRLDDLLREYQKSGGQATGARWFREFGRLQSLQHQVEEQVRQFSQYADQAIRDEQRAAIEAALVDSEHLVAVQLPPGVHALFQRLPTAAVENLAGMLRAGTPLEKLLSSLGPEAGQAFSDALLRGVALGIHSNEIVRMVRKELGNNLIRALRISRTEVLRSYREASRQNYLNNRNLVDGWIWRSARNTRTCAACWAMDGTEHSLDERLDDHPNGRCFMQPKVKSWKELGFDVPEAERRRSTGVDAFELLSDEKKLAVLGPAKYLAYRAKEIGLKDLVGRQYSKVWGSMRFERSLVDVLGEKKAKEFYPVPGRRTGGFTWFKGELPGVDAAIQQGKSAQGWVYHERILRSDYLPRFNLIDDVEHTLGLWGSPEPSFNAHVKGKVKNVLAFARTWGKDYNQEAMAILLPTQGGQGGKLSWDFGRQLSMAEMDELLGGLKQVNDELFKMTDAPLGMIGLTVKDYQRVEFWVHDDKERKFGLSLIQNAIQKAKLSVVNENWEGGYYYRLLSQENGDY